MLVLRPYQQQLVDDTRQALKQFSSVLMQAPTGAGKTAITVYMMGRAAEMNKRAMFLVHQNELLFQTSKALWKQKLQHGVIASGKAKSKMLAQVASVQTLVRRLDQYQEPDLIIIDECHRSQSVTYQKIIAAYPNALVIGLTATPERTDKKGLGDTYQTMVSGPTISQLISAGYLSDYEILAPPSQASFESIKTRMGDYDKKELEATLDKPTITGDAVATYKKHASGKRCVVMCVSIKHAQHVTENYVSAGVKAEMIEGSMTTAQRENVLNRFRTGETLIICNVQLLIEGVDIPSIEVVQWLRPTQSLIIWMQGNGRGLRPFKGKEKLLIMDHVGNWKKHGLPDDVREWSLEGDKKGKRKAKDEDPELHIQQCKACYHVFRAGVDTCPSCGKPVERKTAAQIQVIEGELERVNIENERKRQKVSQGMARSIEDLVRVGIDRGMNRPAQWAAIINANREKRKPRPDEFEAARRAFIKIKGES